YILSLCSHDEIINDKSEYISTFSEKDKFSSEINFFLNKKFNAELFLINLYLLFLKFLTLNSPSNTIARPLLKLVVFILPRIILLCLICLTNISNVFSGR